MKTMPIIKKGFTLIELLVVISIIAILATLLIANFNATRGRARDAQRKSDMRNIQTALRLYYNDYGRYPTGTNDEIYGCGDGFDQCLWGEEFSAQSVYMSKLPEDPQVDRSYVYEYVDDDNYNLSACLENVSDENCSGNCGSAYGTGLTGCVYTVSP